MGLGRPLFSLFLSQTQRASSFFFYFVLITQENIQRIRSKAVNQSINPPIYPIPFFDQSLYQSIKSRIERGKKYAHTHTHSLSFSEGIIISKEKKKCPLHLLLLRTTTTLLPRSSSVTSNATSVTLSSRYHPPYPSVLCLQKMILLFSAILLSMIIFSSVLLLFWIPFFKLAGCLDFVALLVPHDASFNCSLELIYPLLLCLF